MTQKQQQNFTQFTIFSRTSNSLSRSNVINAFPPNPLQHDLLISQLFIGFNTSQLHFFIRHGHNKKTIYWMAFMPLIEVFWVKNKKWNAKNRTREKKKVSWERILLESQAVCWKIAAETRILKNFSVSAAEKNCKNFSLLLDPQQKKPSNCTLDWQREK